MNTAGSPGWPAAMRRMSDISPSQAAGSDRRRGTPPSGVRGGTGSQEGGPPRLGSLGPARPGVAVGETCWVSSSVFPRKAGSCSPGWKVG